MSHKRLTDEDVISQVLKDQGFTVSADRIRRWIVGDDPIPPEIQTALETIVDNFDYHLSIAQSKMLFEPAIADEALQRIHSLDPVSIHLAKTTRHAKKSGHKHIHFRGILLPAPLADAFNSMVTATGMKRSAFISLWLRMCIEAVIDRTEAYAIMARKQRQRQKSKVLSKRERVRDKRYQRIVDQNEDAK